MKKIKDIIKEHKIIMTEAFKSATALANNWRGLDLNAFSHTEQNLVLSGTRLQIKKLKQTLNQRKKV